MLEATVANLSPAPRRHWGVVTFPAALVADFGIECAIDLGGGRSWRAVRGGTQGRKTVYRIRAEMDGEEVVSGALINRAHGSATPVFRAHDWVTDDRHALIPDLGVASDGRTEWTPPESLSFMLVASSPAHQRFLIRRQLFRSGIHLWSWLDVLHEDPVVPFWALPVWSDRDDPRLARTFSGIALRFGELPIIDFAVRHGCVAPFQDGEGRWITQLIGDVTMPDGVGLPVSGCLAAYVGPEVGGPEPAAGDDLANLRAAWAGCGGIVGVSHDWDGHWLAGGWVPRVDGRRVALHEEAEREWARFRALEETPADWFAVRPLGLSRYPGSTGAQQDFGATKDALVVSALDPRWIRALGYSVASEAFRGILHYENDGRLLRTVDHPGLLTWYGRPHTSGSDLLGKTPGPWPGSWIGQDEEHRSANSQAAYLALTDDPLHDHLAEAQLEVDAASYRIRRPYTGGGATRAQGRFPQAMAQLASVCRDDVAARYRKLVRDYFAISAASPNLRVAGPMKVVSWGHPDGRKRVYDEQGNLGRWTSMWELGLFVVGVRVAMAGESEIHSSVLEIACETLARFGACWDQSTQRWRLVDDILWSDGADVPGGLRPGSPHVWFDSGSGVATWTFAGLLVAREVLGPDHELAGKLDDVIAERTGGAEAASRTLAEWWAAVRQVPPA